MNSTVAPSSQTKLPPGNPKNLHSVTDVLAAGAIMAVRQPGAGAQMLFEVLVKRADIKARDLARLDPPHRIRIGAGGRSGPTLLASTCTSNFRLLTSNSQEIHTPP